MPERVKNPARHPFVSRRVAAVTIAMGWSSDPISRSKEFLRTARHAGTDCGLRRGRGIAGLLASARPMRLRSSHLIERWPAVAGGVALVVAASVLTLGPGTDLDTGAVIRSGRTIMDGDYVASRAPGAPVHEAAV